MRTPRIQVLVCLLLLLAGVTLALVYAVEVRVVDDVPVKLELPVQVGPWRGDDVFFCHQEKCLRSVLASQVSGGDVCPSCGGKLRLTWSLGESCLLPADTLLLRRAYVHPDGRQVTVSIVVSGKEQVSIHRPEICLVAQGNEVASRTTVDVPIEGRQPLKVRVLKTFHRFRVSAGRTAESRAYFAYWFMGADRETPYHAVRMVYSAMDRLVSSRGYRWAYVSVSGPDAAGSYSSHQQVRDFARLLYPLIRGR